MRYENTEYNLSINSKYKIKKKFKGESSYGK